MKRLPGPPMTSLEAHYYAVRRDAEGVPHTQIAAELTQRGYRVGERDQALTTGGIKYLLKPRRTAKWAI